MKIVQLRAANVKRLDAVEITPEGHLVVIGGENDQGKSSVLDSIMYALAGGSALPGDPLRQGTRKGAIRLDLGDLIVERRFTSKGGTSVVVTTADGVELKSPQAILDALCGKIAFDPLEFARKRPKEQLETLRQMVGLDLSAFDEKRQKAYDARTAVNKSKKELEAGLAAFGPPAAAPAEEVSIAELVKQLEDILAHNREVDRVAERRRLAELSVETTQGRIDRLKAELADLEAALAKARVAVEEIPFLAPMVGDDDLRQKIAEAEGVNQRVRANRERAAVEKRLGEAEQSAENLTAEIEAVEAEKAAAVAAATFPYPGLGFGDEGILLDGLPFEQASSSKRIKASAAIGMAMNPKLRVLLVRDGSLLDPGNLEMLAKMAAEADSQIWVERVGEGAECSVIIEDGHVKETRAAAGKAVTS